MIYWYGAIPKHQFMENTTIIRNLSGILIHIEDFVLVSYRFQIFVIFWGAAPLPIIYHIYEHHIKIIRNLQYCQNGRIFAVFLA